MAATNLSRFLGPRSPYTLEAGASYAAPPNIAGVIVDKTIAGATAITLPPNPAFGQPFFALDGRGDAGTNAITITPATGTVNGAASVTLSTDRGCFKFIRGKTEWKLVSVL